MNGDSSLMPHVTLLFGDLPESATTRPDDLQVADTRAVHVVVECQIPDPSVSTARGAIIRELVPIFLLQVRA